MIASTQIKADAGLLLSVSAPHHPAPWKQHTRPGQLGQHRSRSYLTQRAQTKAPTVYGPGDQGGGKKGKGLRVENSQSGEKCLQASPSFSMKEALTEELEKRTMSKASDKDP